MKQLPIILLLILGIAILIYYILIIVIGKRTAKLLNSKDKYIWNGLKLVEGNIKNIESKSITMFLDQENLVFTSDDILKMYSTFKNNEVLENAFGVNFYNLKSFDIEDKYGESSMFAKFFAKLSNNLYKTNSYRLLISFLDDEGDLVELKLKSSAIQMNEFEETYADFNRRIYALSGIRINKAQHVKTVEEPIEEPIIVGDVEGTTVSDQSEIDKAIQEEIDIENEISDTDDNFVDEDDLALEDKEEVENQTDENESEIKEDLIAKDSESVIEIESGNDSPEIELEANDESVDLTDVDSEGTIFEPIVLFPENDKKS